MEMCKEIGNESSSDVHGGSNLQEMFCYNGKLKQSSCRNSTHTVV